MRSVVLLALLSLGCPTAARPADGGGVEWLAPDALDRLDRDAGPDESADLSGGDGAGDAAPDLGPDGAADLPPEATPDVPPEDTRATERTIEATPDLRPLDRPAEVPSDRLPDLAPEPPVDRGLDRPVACPAVRVNEVATAGPSGAAWEFVELVGPPGADLGAYRLVYRSRSGTSDVELIGAGDWTEPTVPASGIYLTASSAYTGEGTVRARFAVGPTGRLAASAGAVWLLDAGGARLDGVGWGDAPGEGGTSAPAPGAAQSIEREPACDDTGSSAADFVLREPPTPGR